MPNANPRKLTKLILYRVDEGTRAALAGKATKATTGQGQKDLRLRPAGPFKAVLEELLPNRAVRRTHGKNAPEGGYQREVLVGAVKWNDPAKQPQLQEAEMTVWPPNGAKRGGDGEWRIGTVNRFGWDKLVKDDPDGGRSVLMLFKLGDGSVWAWFTTESSLRSTRWQKPVRDFAGRWFDAESKAAFADFESGTEFLNGEG